MMLTYMRIAVLVVLSLTGLPALAQSTADQWLQRMTEADISYEGVFVSVAADEMSSMAIKTLNTDDGDKQQIYSLTGEAREIITENGVVACYLPAQNSGTRHTGQSQLEHFKLAFDPTLASISDNYTLMLGSEERVAGQLCQRIDVVPNDNYRYGYQLCIDTSSYLLLESKLIGTAGDELEKHSFTQLSYELSDKTITPVNDIDSLLWVNSKQVQTSAQVSYEDRHWQLIEDATNGFSIQDYMRRYSPMFNTELEHLVLKDGLAAVSVFIIPIADNTEHKQMPMVSAGMGGFNSITVFSDGAKIIVMGEVPKRTVKKIAESIVMP